MEQKAEELREDGWCHPRPQFSVDERVFIVRICILVRGMWLQVPFLPYYY